MAQTRIQTQTTIERLKKEKNALGRAILGHYERLNQAVADGATGSEHADIQDQIPELMGLIALWPNIPPETHTASLAIARSTLK